MTRMYFDNPLDSPCDQVVAFDVLLGREPSIDDDEDEDDEEEEDKEKGDDEDEETDESGYSE